MLLPDCQVETVQDVHCGESETSGSVQLRNELDMSNCEEPGYESLN